MTDTPAPFEPVTIPEGSTYEVHEYIPGRYVWHIFGPDGDVVDAWNRGQYAADDPVTGEYTLYAGDGRKIGEAMFRTELAAHEHAAATGATCRTSWTGGNADPAIAALIARQN